MPNSSITASLLLLIFLFLSCDLREKKPEYNNLQPFKLTINDPLQDLDPIKIIYNSDMLVASFLYDGLVRIGESFDEINPSIAESWNYSNDKKELTFFLRDNVFFHDNPCFPNGKGRKLTSQDILYTFKRIAGSSSGCINLAMLEEKVVGLKDFHNNERDEIDGIKILDSLTVKVILTKPYVSFLKILASPLAYVIPEEAVEFYGDDFSRNPVGTGPFKLTLWNEFEEIVLTKNENYSKRINSEKDIPLLPQIKIKVLPNPGVNLTEFLKGESNLITVLPTLFGEIKKEEDFLKKFNFQKINYGTVTRFFGFSMDKKTKLTSDKVLRQKLNSKFHKSFNDRNRSKNFSEAHSLLPQSISTFEIQEYSLISDDLDFSNQKIQLLTSLETGDSKILSEILANSQNINFDFVIEPARYYRKIIENRPDIFRVSMQPSYPDPEEYYSLFYSKSGKEINLTAYSNSLYDRIFEQALTEFDPNKRNQLFIKLEKILEEDVPAIWASHEKARYIIFQKNIKGMKFSNMLPDLRYAYFE